MSTAKKSKPTPPPDAFPIVGIGKGVGLFISHSYVQEHGGKLSAESEPGEWTRFHVDLPAENGWRVGDVSQ